MSGNLKSQENIALDLIRGLLDDFRTHHQISPREIERDFGTIRNRTYAEGISFLTKTLPKIAKSLDLALKGGQFTPLSEFSHDKGTNYPRLFRRLLELVLDKKGVVKRDADISAIADIRQVCYLFYKYQIPYLEDTVDAAIKKYIEIDKNISDVFDSADQMAAIYYAREVFSEIFKNFSLNNPVPKNGPGAVAGGEMPWERFKPSRFYPKLDGLVPYPSFYFYNDRHLFDHWSTWFDLDFGSGGTAKLLVVPKDSRGPRLISKEPLEFMAYEQALMRLLTDHVESHPLTSGQVNFTDQSINGNLALKASETCQFATLDLSAASDRLSLGLVSEIFGDDTLGRYITSARCEYSKTPYGRIRLQKYAPMGSALTFPVQAITFYCLIVGRMIALGTPLANAARNVWVYGDDIIVPNEFTPEAIEVLELVGLKVNTEKSCYGGHFRESCGVDAYRGSDITPVKLKKLWQAKPDVSTLKSWIDTSNLLFVRGYWRASDKIKSLVEKSVGKLPIVSPSSSLLGFSTWSKDLALRANNPRRWSTNLQCWTYRGFRVSTRPVCKLDGWERLLQCGWYKPIRTSLSFEGEDFSSGVFTVRHAVTKKRAVVAESGL